MSPYVAFLAQSPAAGHPIWHFGLVAGAGLVTFAGIKAVERWKQAGRELHKPSPPMVALALLGLASSVIHGLLCSEHFQEWVVYGVFFVGATALQAAWSVMVLLRPTRRLLLSGALGNTVIVCTFVVSRVIGIPFGPEAFRPEELSALGVVATICELAVLVGAAYRSRGPSIRIGHRVPTMSM